MRYNPPDMEAHDFTERIRRSIAAHRMFTAGDGVLVAVSGGADSVALLRVLHLLAPELRLRLTAAHLNHGLRPEAERDAAFVRRLASELGIDCRVETCDVRALGRREGLCLEEAGRRARYAFFEDLARQRGCGRIALGHHMDDNAEQVLLALLRGSGPAGLSAMAPVRAGRFVRPLIDVTRADIHRFLAALGCAYITDRSNLDPRFVRNRVRHVLLPLLRSAFNPRVVRALNRTRRILADEEDWARQRAGALFREVAVAVDDTEVMLAAGPLGALHPAARRRVVRLALERLRGDLRRIDFAHVQQVLALLEAADPGGRLHLPGGVIARRRGEVLALRLRPAAGGRPRENAGSVPDFSRRLDDFGRVYVPEAGVELRFSPLAVEKVPVGYGTGQCVAFFDIDSVKFPLVVRNIRPGDRFVPLGMRGSKKVARFFSDCKIPASRRRRIPLVISGGRIIWVAGWRIDQRARLTGRSRAAVRGELVLA